MVEIGEVFTQVIKFYVWNRFVNESAFRSGFCWGLSIALMIGWIAQKLLYGRSRFLQFFRPTQIPAVNPGPSPFQTFMGCAGPILIMFILVTAIAGYFLFFS